MRWIIEQWAAFAGWTNAQPLVIKLAVGSALLLMAYVSFAFLITRLMPRPKLPFGDGG